MFSSVTRLGQRVRWEEAGAPLLGKRETLGEERREDRGKVQGQGTGRTRGKRRLRREVTVGGGKGEAVGQGKGEAKEALTRECPQALQPAADNFCIVSSKA